MTKRITQLGSRGLGVVFLGIAGALLPEVDEGTKVQIQDFAATAATAMVGFGALLADLLIHRVMNGGVLAAPEAGGVIAPKDVEILKSTGSKLKLIGMVLVLGSSAVMIPACSALGEVVGDRDTILLDRATDFAETIGPEFVAYVEADPTLTDDQKAIRRDRVRLHREMLAAYGR